MVLGWPAAAAAAAKLLQSCLTLGNPIDGTYGWEVISGDEQPSAQWEHTLLMTEHGVEVLSY